MKKFIINKKEIPKGKNTTVQLNVGRLPSGTRIHIQVNVYRAEKDGSCMLVIGGIHGDEINGVETVRKACSEGYFDELETGSVIAIPLLNVYGFINFSREVPDGKDVNRSFPGSSAGSLSSKIARTITKEILPLVDFGVDFHTGGASRYNYPQIRYSTGDQNAAELAKVFNAPYCIAKSMISKSFRKVAHGMGIPIIVFEGGESLRLDGLSIQKGLEGLQNILDFKGLKKGNQTTYTSKFISKTSWLRATSAGVFKWTKSSGQWVEKDEKIGIINDPYGHFEYPIIAKKSGYIIGHNNAPVVNHGDALFHIGYEF